VLVLPYVYLKVACNKIEQSLFRTLIH